MSLITRLKRRLRRSQGTHPLSIEVLYDYGFSVPMPEGYREAFYGYDPAVGAAYIAYMPAPLLPLPVPGDLDENYVGVGDGSQSDWREYLSAMWHAEDLARIAPFRCARLQRYSPKLADQRYIMEDSPNARMVQCHRCDELFLELVGAAGCDCLPCPSRECIDCGALHDSVSNRCWDCRTYDVRCGCGEWFRLALGSTTNTDCPKCRMKCPPALPNTCEECREGGSIAFTTRGDRCERHAKARVECACCGLGFDTDYPTRKNCNECYYIRLTCPCGNAFRRHRDWSSTKCTYCEEYLDCDECGTPFRIESLRPSYYTSPGSVRCRPCHAVVGGGRRATCMDCGERFGPPRRSWHRKDLPRDQVCKPCGYTRKSAERQLRVERNALKRREKLERAQRRAARLLDPNAKKRDAAARRRQRIIDASTGEPVTNEMLAEIRKGTCVYCGAPGEHADHIMPLCRGGHHRAENLVAACGTCNGFKHTLTLVELKAERPDLVIHACLMSPLVLAQYAREMLGGTLNGPHLPPITSALIHDAPTRRYSYSQPPPADLPAAFRAMHAAPQMSMSR